MCHKSFRWFVFLLAGACGSPAGPADQAELLAVHRALWSRQGPASYQFTLTRSCECLADLTTPVRIVVVNQVVNDRRYVTGAPVDPQYEVLFTSVPGLFDLIQQAVDARAPALAVRYNAHYGYPESIQIDWVAGTADDEVSYRITDFGPVVP